LTFGKLHVFGKPKQHNFITYWLIADRKSCNYGRCYPQVDQWHNMH